MSKEVSEQLFIKYDLHAPPRKKNKMCATLIVVGQMDRPIKIKLFEA